MNKNIYVNFGCGTSISDAFLNYDSSPSLVLSRLPIIGLFLSRYLVKFQKPVYYGNIVKGLPLSDNSIKGIYSSHVLEHLSYEDCLIALKNSYSYLMPGGIFRCVLPNFESMVRNYLTEKENGNRNACNEFMTYSFLGKKAKKRSVLEFWKEYYSGSLHLWMWDFESLSEELTKVGFKEVKRSYYNKSEDRTFNQVENQSRFDYDALCVEAKK